MLKFMNEYIVYSSFFHNLCTFWPNFCFTHIINYPYSYFTHVNVRWEVWIKSFFFLRYSLLCIKSYQYCIVLCQLLLAFQTLIPLLSPYHSKFWWKLQFHCLVVILVNYSKIWDASLYPRVLVCKNHVQTFVEAESSIKK